MAGRGSDRRGVSPAGHRRRTFRRRARNRSAAGAAGPQRSAYTLSIDHTRGNPMRLVGDQFKVSVVYSTTVSVRVRAKSRRKLLSPALVAGGVPTAAGLARPLMSPAGCAAGTPQNPAHLERDHGFSPGYVAGSDRQVLWCSAEQRKGSTSGRGQSKSDSRKPKVPLVERHQAGHVPAE